MLTSPAAVAKGSRPAYRPYLVSVSGIQRLSPHFTRVTFSADCLADVGTDGLDQRVKLLFPLEHGRHRGQLCDVGADDSAVIAEGSWYARWRALPDNLRAPFRTYTIRSARPEAREIDIDMVLHVDGGPASRWLSTATVGDALIIIGPDRHSRDSAIGIDWHPGDASEFLLIGDETAAPAICSVVDSLPAGVSARAFIEVPSGADVLPVSAGDGVTVTWLPRDGAEHGSRLIPAVRAWVDDNPTIVAGARATAVQTVAEIDVDTELLWEGPERADAGFYGWLAGESSVVKTLRRFLVTESGIDRRRIAFMGYWRHGKSELQ